MKNFINKLKMWFLVKRKYVPMYEKYIAKHSLTDSDLIDIFQSMGDALKCTYNNLTIDNPQLQMAWSELFPLRIHKNQNVVYIISEEGDVYKQVIYQELMSSKVQVTNIYAKEE